MTFASVFGDEVTIDRPSEGEPEAVELGCDLVVVITVATSSSSDLLVTIRRCKHSSVADIALSKVIGLISVAGKSSVSAGDGSVAWASGSVTVHVAAAAFAHFGPGLYFLALEEVTAGGRRLPKHSRELMLYRTAGGLRVT